MSYRDEDTLLVEPNSLVTHQACHVEPNPDNVYISSTGDSIDMGTGPWADEEPHTVWDVLVIALLARSGRP